MSVQLTTPRRWTATGAGAMSATFTNDSVLDNRIRHVTAVRLHLSAVAAATENFTIQEDSNSGATYDNIVLRKSTVDVQDIRTEDGMWFTLLAGDKLVMTWANAGALTWGLEVIYRMEL